MQRVHGWIGRKDREDVAVEAVVHRDDGSDARVRLTNVSDEGCRIEWEGSFRIGEQLSISTHEGRKVNAQVRWALPGSAGARFVAE